MPSDAAKDVSVTVWKDAASTYRNDFSFLAVRRKQSYVCIPRWFSYTRSPLLSAVVRSLILSSVNSRKARQLHIRFIYQLIPQHYPLIALRLMGFGIVRV